METYTKKLEKKCTKHIFKNVTGKEKRGFNDLNIKNKYKIIKKNNIFKKVFEF